MSAASLQSQVEDSVAKINDEVAVGEDLKFQERWWRFENAVWIVFSFILLCTVLGVFGRGPLSHGILQNEDMKIRYERIARTGTPSLMEIEFASQAIHHNKIQLYVSESIVKEFGAQRIIPAPLETSIGNGGLTYVFPASATPASIKFALQPDGPGVFHFAIGEAGQQPLEGKAFIMP